VKTLDRYLLREILAYLSGGVAVVVLLLLGGVLFEAMGPLLTRGIGGLEVARYLAWRVPEALARGLPIAYLFALLLALSRMAEDAELKVLLASGIPRTRVLLTLVGLGTALAGLGFWLGAQVVPTSSQKAREVLQQAILARPLALLEPGSFFTDATGELVYVGQVAEGGLKDVRVLSPGAVLAAPEGRFSRGTLFLQKGIRITYEGSRPRTVATFAQAKMTLRGLATLPRAPLSELSPAALKARIAEAKRRGTPYAAEATAYWRKWAEPAASVVFALFAGGLAFWLLGGTRTLGLVGVVTVTFFYYATWSVFRIMGEQGVLAPWIAAWGPDLIYLALALALLGVGRR